LSKDNKNRRRNAALTLLSKFRKKDSLHKIITADEKWILYDNPKRRKLWVNPGQPSILTPKPNIHGKMVLLRILGLERCVVLRVVTTTETITADR